MTTRQVHIYGPSFSNFVRSVMLVCEENQINYTVGFEIDGKEVAFKSEQHFELHPFGKIPVLIEDNLLENRLVLPETASICRYLDQNKNLQPTDVLEEAKHDAFCALVSINIDKALIRDYLIEFAFPKGENNQVRLDVAKKAIPQVVTALEVITKQLEKPGVIGGEQMTIADILLAPMLAYLSGLAEGFNLLPNYPSVQVYLDKLMTHESCQKILKPAKSF
jgi:glutathione S-transferase